MSGVQAAPQFDPGELLRRYRLQTALHDEMATPAGGVRPHWEYLFQSFLSLGPGELADRRDEAERLLRENGVTYNVYDDPRGNERLWQLDPVPLVLTSQEWSGIESGLIQRAELLDLILRDLYGQRKLISRGLIPAEIIYSHPGFWLPCSGSVLPERRHLFMYAADLVRQPDGDFVVVGDRTQAPSGAGYALENRIVMSRIAPSLYRDSHVHRVSLFFRSMRSTLINLGMKFDENPRVVLLTPGSGNETYFEQAYLANYLGFSLVEGNDLVIRDGMVWIKALDGLKRVHVILRRLDDSYCDPLELRQDSLLGTPGLLQAARSGNVVLCNALGCGVLENSALKRFLPELSRRLLGQELRLPSYETYWCGLAADRKYVISNISRLVVKPLHPHRGKDEFYGPRLSGAQRRQVIERIQLQPYLYVAQPPLVHSTTPVFVNDTLQPRPMVLRSFLAATDDSYVVMPGGLTRVGLDREERMVSNQRGGISKDTWVLASEREQQVSLLQRTPTNTVVLALTRDGGEIAGRVADNLFWLGRYTERVESTARLLREVTVRQLDGAPARQDVLSVLYPALTHQTGTYPGFLGMDPAARPQAAEQELLSVILNPEREGSLKYNLNRLTQCGWQARDRMSEDAWRVITNLDDDLCPPDAAQPVSLEQGLEGLERVVLSTSALIGLITESMTRGQGYYFMEVGRRVERALGILTLLQSSVAWSDASRPGLWEALLAISDSRMTYGRRYRQEPQAGAVLDLLLQDETNPRAVRFQLSNLRQLVSVLPGEGDQDVPGSAVAIVTDALGLLPTLDVDSLVTVPDEADWRQRLGDFLEQLSGRMRELSKHLATKYFALGDLPQQMVPLIPGDEQMAFHGSEIPQFSQSQSQSQDSAADSDQQPMAL